MGWENHIDIHQPKEQDQENAIMSTTVVHKKKQQLDKDVVIQSKEAGNYTWVLSNSNVLVPTFFHLS